MIRPDVIHYVRRMPDGRPVAYCGAHNLGKEWAGTTEVKNLKCFRCSEILMAFSCKEVEDILAGKGRYVPDQGLETP